MTYRKNWRHKMNRRTGKELAAIICVTVVLAGILSITCGGINAPSEPAPSITTVDELILGSQAISGWERILNSWNPSDTLFRFDQSTINVIVDGGNVSYCNSCNGSDSPMKNGVHYSMIDSQKTTSVDIFTIDYGRVSAATAELNSRTNYLLSSYPTKTKLPSFAESVVLAGAKSGGMMVIGHFAQYYFELTFVGYSSSTDAAADANSFMTLFQSKVK
jgi:hypothetical protein